MFRGKDTTLWGELRIGESRKVNQVQQALGVSRSRGDAAKWSDGRASRGVRVVNASAPPRGWGQMSHDTICFWERRLARVPLSVGNVSGRTRARIRRQSLSLERDDAILRGDAWLNTSPRTSVR